MKFRIYKRHKRNKSWLLSGKISDSLINVLWPWIQIQIDPVWVIMEYIQMLTRQMYASVCPTSADWCCSVTLIVITHKDKYKFTQIRVCINLACQVDASMSASLPLIGAVMLLCDANCNQHKYKPNIHKYRDKYTQILVKWMQVCLPHFRWLVLVWDTNYIHTQIQRQSKHTQIQI